MKKLSIVIPCYNEVKNLPGLVHEITSSMDRDDIEVILVNNGSQDESGEVLEKITKQVTYIKVVHIAVNQGYGYGVLTGLATGSGKYLGWMHGDLQTSFKDVLVALVELEAQGEPEDVYVKGLRKGRSLPDQFFTVGMSFFETLLLGKALWDVNAQPNIFHRSFFESWQNPPKDFSLDLYALYHAHMQRLQFIRIPVVFPPREHGHSHWNVGLASKVKFIKRTVDFSLTMRFGNRIVAELTTIFKYLTAGSLGVSIHLGLLYIFTDIFDIHYLVSTSLALLIVFWISFFLQKYWTFKETSSDRIKRQAVLYFLMHTGNFIANGTCMYILVSVLGMWYMLSQVVVSLSIAAFTFVLNKKYIFSKK